MPRYIDADELGERLEKMLEISVKMDYFNGALIESLRSPSRTIGLQDALRALETEPTANVQEVRHGRWINGNCGDYVCSVCGWAFSDELPYMAREYDAETEEIMRYCMHCGAKMDGGAGDE